MCDVCDVCDVCVVCDLWVMWVMWVLWVLCVMCVPADMLCVFRVRNVLVGTSWKAWSSISPAIKRIGMVFLVFTEHAH